MPAAAPATAPPPLPPPRRSQRHISHTDGETSGYHSDNHLIDPAAVNYHLRRQLPSSRGRVEPLPPDTSVILDHQDGPDVVSARADYKFLERKKWVQDGTVPYDLYPEVCAMLHERSLCMYTLRQLLELDDDYEIQLEQS